MLPVVRLQRNRADVAVAMIDIDHCKAVNNAHGHAVGDRVHRSLARLFRQRLRTTDMVGRYGGEEFLAILPGANAPQAREVIDDIRNTFLQIAPSRRQRGILRITEQRHCRLSGLRL